MATFFLVLVIILFVLAISDLVVGVSNDAVNFLNAAIGSRAAAFKTVMLVAALGVLVGATFSSGMMEVARKGIFRPEYFYFSEIIILFLAVMVTDVILLDTFNTYGLPTSTTVSIVFELLGAAVAISAIKVMTDPDALELIEYINSGKALAIISGILLSVVIAFTAGAIAQYVSRMLFSFDYNKPMRQFGAIWGGLGIMAITYFILIKGAKGASFMSAEMIDMVRTNTLLLMGISFVGWTIVLYLLNRIFKIDILTVLVLVGTFALAMAFAGNDLVNFIGVPLAGYNSYQLFMEAGGTGADAMLMDGLAGKVPTPTLLLLLAGVIMVVTLYTSKKARSVVQTSLDLGRQDEGYERFSSFLLSRVLVRRTSSAAMWVNSAMPSKMTDRLNKQFDQHPFTSKQKTLGEDAPVFDKVRASVTLVIASILIAVGTNLKLPLSTTYVTFMVFMGASLADGAWSRDSAVYRVSGMLSVIGGWFFTAFSAFTAAFILAVIFYFGGMPAIIIVVLLAFFFIYRTHRLHHSRVAVQKELASKLSDGVLDKSEVIELSKNLVDEYLNTYKQFINESMRALREEKLSTLSKLVREFKPVIRKSKQLKASASEAFDTLPEHELEFGHAYMLIVDYLHEMARKTRIIIKANLHYVDNNHSPLKPEQFDDLDMLKTDLMGWYDRMIRLFEEPDASDASTIYNGLVNEYTELTRKVRSRHIQRIKNNHISGRNSQLFLNHLAEFRNLELYAARIVKVFDDLIIASSEK